MDKYTPILPISYFGPIEYLMLINQYEAQIEAHENYQKRSIRNKTTIMAANGPQILSVPLVKGKTITPIKAVKISYDEAWPQHHLKTIVSAYGNSPYYEHYLPYLEKILTQKHVYLFDLNMDILAFYAAIGLITSYRLTNAFVKVTADQPDYRRSGYKWAIQDYHYNQVFEEKYGFVGGLSCLDLIFNRGPEAALIVHS